MTSKRTSVLALSALFLTACGAQRPGGSGSGRPTSTPGGVYRTTAHGSPVGGEKATNSGGGRGRLNDLAVAGLVTLGASYGATVVGGQIVKETMFSDFDRSIGANGAIDRLWFPVLGAWSALIYNEDTVRSNCELEGGNCDLTTLGSSMIFLGAAAQTTGVILTVVGLLKGGKGGGGGKPSGFVIAPHGSAESAGFAVRGGF